MRRGRRSNSVILDCFICQLENGKVGKLERWEDSEVKRWEMWEGNEMLKWER